MGLKYDFESAKKKIAMLDADERRAAEAICRDIHDAERRLDQKAAPLLAHCLDHCQGLCCRNIRPADIITRWDLVYILLLAPQVESAVEKCLAAEDFYPGDCVFLADGIGPCLFPDHFKPERCVISFCRVEPSVEKEIADVMAHFSRLIRFFMFRPLRRLSRWLPASCRRRTTSG